MVFLVVLLAAEYRMTQVKCVCKQLEHHPSDLTSVHGIHPRNLSIEFPEGATLRNCKMEAGQTKL